MGEKPPWEDIPVIGPYIGPSGWLLIVVLSVISVIRGWLVPRLQVEALLQAYKEVITNQNRQIERLYTAIEVFGETTTLLLKNQNELLEASKTTHEMLHSFIKSVREEQK